MKPLIGIVGIMSIVFSGCSIISSEKETSFQDTQKTYTLVTSFAPIYAHVSRIVGDKMQVHNLIPIGKSIHLWEPAPRDIALLSQANLIFFNGLHLEDHFMSLVPPEKKSVLFEISSNLPTLTMKEHYHENEEEHEATVEHEEEHNEYISDPHVWLSIPHTLLQIDAILSHIITLDPDNADIYTANATTYRNELTSLHAHITESFARSTPASFFTLHEAYNYFLTSYELENFFMGTIEDIAGREATQQDIRKLVDLIQEHSIRILFTEPQLSDKITTLLQKETGVRTFEINPIGYHLSPNGYIENMTHLSDTLLEAFSYAAQ